MTSWDVPKTSKRQTNPFFLTCESEHATEPSNPKQNLHALLHFVCLSRVTLWPLYQIVMCSTSHTLSLSHTHRICVLALLIRGLFRK